MRVLGVLVALVATPVLVGVSQDPGQAATRAATSGACATADAKRSPTAVQNSPQPLDPKARQRVGCAPATPPAPPLPPPPPPASGTAMIEGFVYYDMDGRPPLPNFVIELSGPVNTSAVSDAWGRYSFTGLPAGTYKVCEQVPVSWIQTFPGQGVTCATGFGYSFSLTDGTSGSAVNFGNQISFF